MKKAVTIIICIILFSVILASCSEDESIGIIGGADGPTAIVVSDKGGGGVFTQIAQDEAKRIMGSGEEYILLDVREQDEFDEGHIPGAMLIPYTEIENKAEEMISDKDKQILVYCRTGRRSKIAAAALAKIGYTNVKEFGGIVDWKYEVVNNDA